MQTKNLQAGALISAFILLSLFIFSFIDPGTQNIQTTPSPLSPGNPTNPFLIGVMQSYAYLPQYDAAGSLNITHWYDGTYFDSVLNRHAPFSDVTGREHLADPVPTSAIQSALSSSYSHNHSRFFWMRPKIEWLADLFLPFSSSVTSGVLIYRV